MKEPSVGAPAAAARSPSPRMREKRWLLPGVLLLALLLRAPLLASRPISHDEQLQLEVSSAPTLAALNEVRTAQDLTPPYYSVLLRLVIFSLGDSPVALRLPSLLAGLACVPVAWQVGRIFSGRIGGRILAIAVAVSPPWVFYSREARSYSFMLLWILSVLAASGLYARRTSGCRFALLALTSVVGVAWQFTGFVVVFAAHAAALVWARARRRATPSFLVGLGAAVALASVVLVLDFVMFLRPQQASGYADRGIAWLAPLFFDYADRGYALRFLVARPVDLLVYLTLGYNQAFGARTVPTGTGELVAFLGVVALLLAAFWIPLGKGVLLSVRRRGRGRALAVFALGPSLGMLLGAGVHLTPFGGTRHCLIVSPGIFLLFAVGVTDLRRRRPRRWNVLLACLGVLVGVLGFHVQKTAYFYDLPGVLKAVGPSVLPGDAAYFLPQIDRPYRYYSERDPTLRFPGIVGHGSWDEGEVEKEIERLLESSPRVWVVSEGGKGSLYSRLNRVAEPIAVERGTNCEAVLWTRRPRTDAGK